MVTENVINISKRLHSIEKDVNVLAGADEVFDDTKNKRQSEINAEVGQALDTLQTQIAEETSNREQSETALETELKEYTDVEQARAETAEQSLREVYAGLTQTDIEVVATLPNQGISNKIYRLVGATTFSDYQFNASDLSIPVLLATYDVSMLEAQNGYYECQSAGNASDKAITANGFVMPAVGGSLKVKMYNKNTANNVRLVINSDATNAKAIFYNGSAVNATNTWEAGETVNIYFDGVQWQAFNVNGASDGVFDISEYNQSGEPLGPTKYDNLSAALGINGNNVPVAYRSGGMSIKFVQSSDNKYVQYMYKVTDAATAATFTNVANWEKINLEQEVDDLQDGVIHPNYTLTTGSITEDGSINSSMNYSYTSAIALKKGQKITVYSQGYGYAAISLYSTPFVPLVTVHSNPGTGVYVASTYIAQEDMQVACCVRSANDYDIFLDDDVAIHFRKLEEDIAVLEAKVVEEDNVVLGVDDGSGNNGSYSKVGLAEYTHPAEKVTLFDYLIVRGVDLGDNLSVGYKVYLYQGELNYGVPIGAIGNQHVLLKSGTITKKGTGAVDYKIDFDSTQTCQQGKMLIVYLVGNGNNISIEKPINELEVDYNYALFSLKTTAEEIWAAPWYDGATSFKAKSLQACIKQTFATVKNLNDVVSELSDDVEDIQYELKTKTYISLDTNSQYFVSQLNGCYVENGKIVSYSYSSKMILFLYTIPAGRYRINVQRDTLYGTIVGTLASVSDFVVGASIASAIVTNPTGASTQTIAFDETTNLFILGRTDTGEKWFVDTAQIVTSSKLDYLQEQVENMFSVDLDIVIPDIVYAIVGTELNIWNDTVSLSVDKGLASPLNYQIRWACNKGKITDRGFRYTPVAGDVGNVSCDCYIYDMRGVLLTSKTFTIKVLAKNALSSLKKIAYFGDSLGASAATALYNNFHNSNRFSGTIPTMLGTRGSTIHYEAAGGYKWSNYATAGEAGFRISVSGVTSMQVGAVYSDGSHEFEILEVNITEGSGNCLLGQHYSGTLIMPSGTLTKVSGGGDDSVPYTDAFQESANPLWNDTTHELDIDQYKQMLVSLGQLSSTSDKIDAVSFQFGINDNTLATNLDTLRGYITDLYNLFVGDNENCLFVVGLTTSSANTLSGSGQNYGATWNFKSYLKNVYTIRKFYLSLLSNFPNMRIATPNLLLDRYYGYPMSTRQVSDRCSETEPYHTNYLHPSSSGYNQMGDAYLAAYVGVLTES